MAGNTSEVARLMQQIRAEYDAALLGMSGYAQVAPHAFIEARERNIDDLRNQLVSLVGDKEATAMVFHQIYSSGDIS